MAVEIQAVEPERRPPDELRRAARAHADRKVARLLTPVTLAPFLSSMAALSALGEVPRRAVGLYTVSAWEGPMHADVPVGTNPTDFLRNMANAALCQIAVASGIQGPNSHLVGGGDALWGAVKLAEHALRVDEATAVVITGFDATGPEGDAGEALSIVVTGAEPAGAETVRVARRQPIVDALGEVVRQFPQRRVVEIEQEPVAGAAAGPAATWHEGAG